MIKLIEGSIFDSKCDLLIIPSNNRGGVTRSIYNELLQNNIPVPPKISETTIQYGAHKVGAVDYFPISGDFANASVIGFAASVEAGKGSSIDILKTVLRRIKYFCIDQSLHIVNIPLLGTGAGGLNAQDVFNLMKEFFQDERSITLQVYVLSGSIYTELLKNETQADQSASQMRIKNPRVFISYTGTDTDNRSWVISLTRKLRSCGVDARLDVFNLKPGQDLPQWMTNELIMADKVLLICDKYYAQKADNRRGGVGWETMIIQGDMLSRPEQTKYIAILRGKDIDQSLPIYVRSKYALDWSEKSQFEAGQEDEDFKMLLFDLFDCETEEPLGEIPSFIVNQMQR